MKEIEERRIKNEREKGKERVEENDIERKLHDWKRMKKKVTANKRKENKY